MTKKYLGDGVFASTGGSDEVILTVENGIGETDCIMLEQEILLHLLEFIKVHFPHLITAL